MTRSVRLAIERLAPTGEGIAHDAGKVVFVDGALPGETVDAAVYQEKAKYARAQTEAVRDASPERRAADSHSARCGGTDWAHVLPEAARRWKRELFLETMLRLGGTAAPAFGELPISASALEYRLRNQFHASRGEVGFYARRSHRIVPLDGCEIVSRETRGKAALFAHAEGTVETLETVETGEAHRLVWRSAGEGFPESPGALDVDVGGRAFRVSAGSFFQVNRHRLLPFFELVRDLAAAAHPSRALDAYSGAGLLSQALVEAGASVTAIEGSPSSAADAAANRERLGAEGRIEIRRIAVEQYLAAGEETHDVVVADPPRGGLGPSAAAIAGLARRRLIYVSCEPGSFARDLRPILSAGFAIAAARLEDFFPLTHRVEAIVAFDRR
ncbi:MAG TPA: TRAM domain-containing protein [Thermoanaerobaculia bacterium]|nr:TRAM domain-containing protein [Thermoanaerobaculia bacterium]